MIKMRNYAVKFTFISRLFNKSQLDLVFKDIGSFLNLQFDEKLNPYIAVNQDIYQYEDISNQTQENIDKITNDFFNFSFDSIVNVPLYKFLVLKNKENLIILANIHSSIFNYSIMKKIYKLFNNSNESSIENKLLAHKDKITDYLNSSDFENESAYWKEYLLDGGDYVKFYNLKSKNYKKLKFDLDKKSIDSFLMNNETSKFDFIASIFSLYLSKIDRTKGCLLKTSIPYENDDVKICEKDALLKIEFLKNNSFTEYLSEFKSILTLQ